MAALQPYSNGNISYHSAVSDTHICMHVLAHTLHAYTIMITCSVSLSAFLLLFLAEEPMVWVSSMWVPQSDYMLPAII